MVCAQLIGLARRLVVDLLEDAFSDLLIGDAFLGGPTVDRQIEVEDAGDRFLQRAGVPLLGVGRLGDVRAHQFVDQLVAQILHRFGDVFLAHDVEPLLEDDLALVVHHVVVLEDLLADVEVARLDLLLRHLQRLVHPRMGDRLTFLQAERLQDAVHAVGAEDAHQVVVEREVELRAARVALTAGAAAQLVVDAAALVTLGGEDVEAAGLERLLLLLTDVRH